MSELVTFLRARLDEDEEHNQPVTVDQLGPMVDAAVKPTILLNQARQKIRLDIATKRQLVEEHEPLAEYAEEITFCGACGGNPTTAGSYPCYTMRLLALPYSRHADYREEWRV